MSVNCPALVGSIVCVCVPGDVPNGMFLFVCLIKVWARPEAIDAGHADYALSITQNILEFYEREFEVAYPVGKLGQCPSS